MQRYFVNKINDEIIFLEKDVFHITKVMRHKIGDQIEVVLDSKAYVAVIDNLSPIKVHILEVINKDAELSAKITLFFPLAKGDKPELVIQKATELGVSRIVFFRSKRCVVKLDDDGFNKKVMRYSSIAKEASEQCHREKVPEVLGVINLQDIDKYSEKINLVAYELLAGNTVDLYKELANKNEGISLLVGPEGGLEESEVDLLLSKGFKAVSLGKRILRCETAAIYMMSVASFMVEK